MTTTTATPLNHTRPQFVSSKTRTRSMLDGRHDDSMRRRRRVLAALGQTAAAGDRLSAAAIARAADQNVKTRPEELPDDDHSRLRGVRKDRMRRRHRRRRHDVSRPPTAARDGRLMAEPTARNASRSSVVDLEKRIHHNG
jgi:hypothetical protein